MPRQTKRSGHHVRRHVRTTDRPHCLAAATDIHQECLDHSHDLGTAGQASHTPARARDSDLRPTEDKRQRTSSHVLGGSMRLVQSEGTTQRCASGALHGRRATLSLPAERPTAIAIEIADAAAVPRLPSGRQNLGQFLEPGPQVSETRRRLCWRGVPPRRDLRVRVPGRPSALRPGHAAPARKRAGGGRTWMSTWRRCRVHRGAARSWPAGSGAPRVRRSCRGRGIRASSDPVRRSRTVATGPSRMAPAHCKHGWSVVVRTRSRRRGNGSRASTFVSASATVALSDRLHPAYQKALGRDPGGGVGSGQRRS